ncbi:MAG: hypothetical protein GY928_01955 [Colwellia sp.]|nr:hypothetical protein [Colwellia sp.]
MSCGICAKLNNTERNAVNAYKGYYNKNGVEYYVYRTEKGGIIKFVRKNSFKIVFERDIKPNYDKGAEFFHIKEYTG